jgi:putative transposase
MKANSNQRQRRSIRLKDYDYTQAGAYFVTICTQGKACILGKVVNGEMRVNKYGNIVDKYWHMIPDHFSNTEIDQFVIMPNHIHGIIVLINKRRGEVTAPLRKHTLGQIVAYFKYQTVKSINQTHKTPGNQVWQRNYYEHVIRNADDLNEIRQYILDNPVKWDMDENNPDRQINEVKPRGELICLTR